MSNKTDVLSFDELARFHGLSLMKWDEDNYASENTELAKDFFEAGQQSKQSEIDVLQNKYDAMYRAFTVADDCRKEWHRCYVGIRQREDELQKIVKKLELINFDSELHFVAAKEHIDHLQKRIDDAVNCLEQNKPSLKMDYKHATNALSILKGEEIK